jgi:hypothetical protein
MISRDHHVIVLHYTKTTLTKVIFFEYLLPDRFLGSYDGSGASVAPISDDRRVVMLVLLIA